MKKVVTLLFCKRPKYARKVLEHLSRCRGIAEYHLVIHLDGPPNREMKDLCSKIGFASHETRHFKQNHGCNYTTREVLERGFALSDFVIHVEEDVLLAPDALCYFEWGRQFQSDSKILNIAAMRHPTGWLFEHGAFPDGQEIEQKVKTDGGFTCWGWATWRDRWVELNKVWSTKSDKDLSWDIRVNEYRAHRKLCQLLPLVSRSQNIGAEDGLHRGDYQVSYWAGSDGFVVPPKYYLVT